MKSKTVTSLFVKSQNLLQIDLILWSLEISINADIDHFSLLYSYLNHGESHHKISSFCAKFGNIKKCLVLSIWKRCLKKTPRLAILLQLVLELQNQKCTEKIFKKHCKC